MDNEYQNVLYHHLNSNINYRVHMNPPNTYTPPSPINETLYNNLLSDFQKYNNR